MKRSTLAAIAAAAVLVVGGGTAYALTTNQEPAPVETVTTTPPETPAAQETPTSAESTAPSEQPAEALPTNITQPGEVCDPHNANDSLCAAFYPDQVVLNMTSAPRSREPLASMPAAEKIALAHQACDNLAAGSQPHLVDTILNPDDHPSTADRNNVGIYAAATLAYCNEFDTGKSAAYIAYYKKLGEEGAKADFADKTMPQL